MWFAIPILHALHQAPTLELPQIFSDGMVLQRNRPVPFFGKAKPGTRVEVRVMASTAAALADGEGRFRVDLPARGAGGPYEVRVSAELEGQTITTKFQDVRFGEVWIASGQSNMEMALGASDSFQEERSNPDSGVRMFTVAKSAVPSPAENVKGKWEAASPQNVGRFSAVGYHFAKELHRRLGVPIGIIHTSWGGTPAQAWTSLPKLTSNPALAEYESSYQKALVGYPDRLKKYQEAMAIWSKRRAPVDPGNKGEEDGWARSGFDDSSWSSVKLPTTFTAAVGSEIIGAVWFRLHVNLSGVGGKSGMLHLGAIDDNDVTYVNGKIVGRTGPEVAAAPTTPRNYGIPAGTLVDGENVIAIRAINTAGQGGFIGPKLRLAVEGQPDVSLEREAKAKLEAVFKPATANAGPAPRPPMGPNNPNSPASLYHGMIAPLIPYAIQGAIWYQGESNAGEAYRYRTLFPAMIEDWRTRWGQGDFGFYFVQLANYMARKPEPAESAWAELREAQSMTLALPNTGQALAIDIGDGGNIHPKNKKEVGRRLALSALVKTYRYTITYSGPTYDRAVFSEDHALVFMKHAELGMKTADGGPVKGFQIAGADRQWVWAEATISGNSLVVKAAGVKKPIAVRYAWADNPDVNLVNDENLPACPFRTDDWKGVTGPK